VLTLWTLACTGPASAPPADDPWHSGTATDTLPTWPSREVDLATASGSGTAGDLPAPYDQELIADGGFEGGLGSAWSVSEGTCGLLDGLSSVAPHSGHLSLAGGTSECVASQELDLLALGFSAADLDRGEVGVTLRGWLRNGAPAGDFHTRDWDDQVRLVLEARDDSGAALTQLATLVAGDDVWRLREVHGLLPGGTRTLTVSVEGTWRAGEIHDSYADGLSLVLRPEVPSTPSLTKGPLLTEARTDGTAVLWETDAPWTSNSLWWRSNSTASFEAAAVTTTEVDDDRYVHLATVSGLPPGQDLDYRVESGTLTTEVHTHTTTPAPGEPLRIGWWGDNQLSPELLSRHLDLMSPEDPDLLVAVGDIVQEGGRLPDWDNEWFAPLDASGLVTTRPVLVVRGNHDGEYPYAYAYAPLPGTGAWYSQTLGDLFLVVLDSEAPTDGDQLTFLEEALASDEAAQAAFVAVTFHRTGWSNTRDLAWGHHLDEAREDWQPVFEAYEVDLVIAGHHHSYQRGTLNGVTYLVIGGTTTLLDSDHWDQFDFLEVEELVNHHGLMEITPDELRWTAYLGDGAVLDEVVLEAEPR